MLRELKCRGKQKPRPYETPFGKLDYATETKTKFVSPSDVSHERLRAPHRLPPKQEQGPAMAVPILPQNKDDPLLDMSGVGAAGGNRDRFVTTTGAAWARTQHVLQGTRGSGQFYDTALLEACRGEVRRPKAKPLHTAKFVGETTTASTIRGDKGLPAVRPERLRRANASQPLWYDAAEPLPPPPPRDPLGARSIAFL
jgi:hypothetical protein